MYVKLPSGDLNPDPYPSYSINTYTCGVTIASRICDGFKTFIKSACICSYIGLHIEHEIPLNQPTSGMVKISHFTSSYLPYLT